MDDVNRTKQMESEEVALQVGPTASPSWRVLSRGVPSFRFAVEPTL
jgi:hypothetical protein